MPIFPIVAPTIAIMTSFFFNFDGDIMPLCTSGLKYRSFEKSIKLVSVKSPLLTKGTPFASEV